MTLHFVVPLQGKGKKRKAPNPPTLAPPPHGSAESAPQAAANQPWAAQVKHVRTAGADSGLPRRQEDARVLAALEPLLEQVGAARGAPPRALLNQIHAVAAPALVPTRQAQRVQSRAPLPPLPPTRQQQQQQPPQQQRWQLQAPLGVNSAPPSSTQAASAAMRTLPASASVATAPLQPILLNPAAAAPFQQQFMFLMSQRRA